MSLWKEIGETADVGFNLLQYTGTILMKNPVFIIGGLMLFGFAGKSLKLGKILDIKL